MSRKFTLVVVRHGEATHNLPDFKPEDLVLTTDDPEMPFLNNPLTEKGLEQAGQLAERLSSEKFNLVLASDLARAWDTAQAIVNRNPFVVDDVQECQLLRERNAGLLNGEREIFKAQLKVEEAIKDRQLLTWRIPGGESVVDLRNRVQAFLQLLLAKAQEQKEAEDLKILVVTHFMWMHELYRVLVSMGGEERQKKPRTPNTGLDQYTLTVKVGEDGLAKLEQVVFDVISCGKHLTQG